MNSKEGKNNIKLNNVKTIILNINEPLFSLISNNLEIFLKNLTKKSNLKEIETYSEKHSDNIKTFIKDYFKNNKNENPLHFKFIEINSYPPKGWNLGCKINQ